MARQKIAEKDARQTESFEHAQNLCGASTFKRWAELTKNSDACAPTPGSNGHHPAPLPAPPHRGEL